MSDYHSGDRPQRQMHDVSHMGLKCAGCGTAITELPFVPDQDRPVFCRDCNRNRRGDRPERAERPQRQMNDVSSMGLKCAGCGTDITELPFVPDQDRPVYCRDCNRDRRPRF